MIYCLTESSFNLLIEGHNFACVVYLNTVASFWFREQLKNFNVIEFYLLLIDT